MDAYFWVTIGTDDAWAPPKLVRLQLENDLVISNADEVSWDIVGEGKITRRAYKWRDRWYPLSSTTSPKLSAGMRLRIEPGALRLEQHPSDPEVNVYETTIRALGRERRKLRWPRALPQLTD